MTENIKLKPDQPRRFYVGIDVTGTIDTLAWGQMWHSIFGWDNLLLNLNVDPTDKEKRRRIDSAHPKLPIKQLFREREITITKPDKTVEKKKITYTDTCLLPQGVDKQTRVGFKASGTYDLWSGADAAANLSDMNAACQFMQTFILNPRVDAGTSSLTDTGTKGIVASVVFISSHGYSYGDMPGDVAFTLSGVERIFLLAQTAANSGQFSGVDWLLLSNCSTLDAIALPDWVTLMSGPTPLRGIVGFKSTCPGPEDSVDIFNKFISELAKGKTIVQAWEAGVRSKIGKDVWVVLCHDAAKGDTIADWNAGKLSPVSLTPPNVVRFDDAHPLPKGDPVLATIDPYDTFWSKNNTVITALNRTLAANKLVAGDTVTITVRLPNPARKSTIPTKFADQDRISLTLIYIRPNKEQEIDVNALFTVNGVTGAKQDPANPTAKLNIDRPAGFDKGPDSWNLIVDGTPTEVVLTLKCKSLSSLHDHDVPLRLIVDIPAERFYFARNGAIEVV